jgi:hypothetical protein
MFPTRFKPEFPESERPHNHDLDRAATGIGMKAIRLYPLLKVRKLLLATSSTYARPHGRAPVRSRGFSGKFVIKLLSKIWRRNPILVKTRKKATDTLHEDEVAFLVTC